jgi:hypothetical protein
MSKPEAVPTPEDTQAVVELMESLPGNRRAMQAAILLQARLREALGRLGEAR